MKRISLMAIIFINSLAVSSASLDIACEWQKSSQHTSSYFRPATFAFSVQKQTVKIVEDTFLFRRYTPCWTGGFSSCAFGFDYDRTSDWTVLEKSENSMLLEAPGYYWSAQLELKTSAGINSLKKGMSFSLDLSGDDGDGVMFNNEAFNCSVL